MDERHRIRFHGWLVQHDLDQEVADAILATMPPYDWHELAAKSDLAQLEQRLDVRFARIDTQFALVQGQFDSVEARFQAFDARFQAADRRFDALDGRFDGVDHRFDALDGRFDRTDNSLAGLATEVRVMLFAVVGMIVSVLLAATATLFA